MHIYSCVHYSVHVTNQEALASNSIGAGSHAFNAFHYLCGPEGSRYEYKSNCSTFSLDDNLIIHNIVQLTRLKLGTSNDAKEPLFLIPLWTCRMTQHKLKVKKIHIFC